MASGPTLQELKALAAALPPSERVMYAEVGDVVSAVVAVVTHGRDILKAAEDGNYGVSEFLHNEIAKFAESEGLEAPVKGQLLTTPAPLSAQPAQPAIDYAKLAEAIVVAQAAQGGGSPSPSSAAPAEPVTPVSSPTQPVESADVDQNVGLDSPMVTPTTESDSPSPVTSSEPDDATGGLI
jgi:hypothetical protein